MLNDGAYPEKATLNFFVDPLGVSGFRLHLLLLGLAVIVLTRAQGRAQRPHGARRSAGASSPSPW